MVSRKAHDSQLIGIRTALRGGASWEQIAEALGVPADFARESFNEAIAERLDAGTPQPPPATWPARVPSADRPYRPDSRARSTASTRSRACSLGRRLVSQEEPPAVMFPVTNHPGFLSRRGSASPDLSWL